MNKFSKKRDLGSIWSGKASFFTLLVLLLSASSVFSQSSTDLFRGTWQIDTPEDGTLILMVKRNGLASYFWGDNTDRMVYQGNWTSTEDAATLVWPDSSQHRIVRDALGFGIEYQDANQNTRYTVPAQQVPNDILGQWAKPPSRDSAVVSAQDRAKGFFGTWQIGDASDDHYIFVESNRSAASTQGSSVGLRGSWAKQGSELHIVWDSGQYSILRENERAYSYKRVRSGAVIEEDTTAVSVASRTAEDVVPSEWLSDYNAEREARVGGIAFSSRKSARVFYRGAWLVRLDEKSFEQIEIGRFGGLTTSTDRKLEGSWRMDGQDIFMRWDNGSRRILSPVGDGFVIYEFKPGRPLDGVPTRILRAAPADASKLTEHLKGRKDVARQMITLADAAGVDLAEQDAGWGRTFARWAWPFGEEAGEGSTSTLLDQAYEEDSDIDPWWWPFWSESLEDAQTAEKQIDEATSQEGIIGFSDDVTSETPDDTAETSTTEAPEKKKRSRTSWIWPF